MKRALAPWAIVLMTVFSGCLRSDGLSDDEVGVDAAPDTPPAPQPVNVTSTTPIMEDPVHVQQVWLNATNCNGATVVMTVDFAQTDPFLPPGFVARDASGLFLEDTPVGKGLVLVPGLNCQTSDLGTGPFSYLGVHIYVEPPAVARAAGASNYDFYQVGMISDHATTLQLLRGWGWSVTNGTTALTLVSVPEGPAAASADVTPDGQPAYSFGVVAPGILADEAPEVGFRDWNLRFWTVRPGSVGFIEFLFSLDVRFGFSVCDFPAGSLPAEVTGKQVCAAVATGPETALGAAFPDLATTSRFVHITGVQAE